MEIKAYFFSLDAFLGAAIVILGVLLASSLYVAPQETSQIAQFSRDMTSVLSEIRVYEVNNSYVQSLIESGEIKNANNSVLEQIGEFWAANKTGQAKYFALNITEGLIPKKYGFGIYADDNVILSAPAINKSLISSRKMVSGIAQSKPTEGFAARAVLSKISGKTSKEFIYFGGYEGDGNITSRIFLQPYDTIQEIYMEMAVNGSFELYINNAYSGTYKDQTGDLSRADKYYVNFSYFSNLKSGDNTIKFRMNESKYIGGGYFRVDYNVSSINYSTPEYDGTYVTKKEYLDGIDGVINIYSSFYIPGELQSMEMFLNYTSNYPFFVNFGNTTIYDRNMTVQEFVNVTIPNSMIASKVSYGDAGKKTIPLRIGHYDVGKFPNISRISDVVVATDVTSSMDTEDVPDAPDQSRLDAAKDVEKDFVNYVLSANVQNRIGLVGYHATTSASRALDLTSNNATIQSKIDFYSTVGGDNTCFSCALADARDQLITLSNSSKKRAILIMSDGQANRCVTPPTACGAQSAKSEAISIACDIFNQYEISIYAIGFGSGADNETLKSISENCSDGLFYHSNNKSSLEKAFKEIAQDILSLEFSYQQAVAQGVYSALYKNSYIEMVYIPVIPPIKFGQIPITVESPPFGNLITTGSISIPENVTISEAIVTSYSGNFWTANLSVNNGSWTTIYSLDSYGSDYPVTGDPYSVHIPPPFLAEGNNNIIITTATSPVNKSGGSEDNRAIYKMLVTNAVSFSGVYSKANGCTWHLTFEDNTNTTVKVPGSYNGTDSCYFSNSTYDNNDAVSVAAYNLLDQLDLDNDGRMDVNLNQESMAMETSTISKVPSLWGPTIIEVRVWQ